MAQLPLSTAIYQLRLVLAGISPMIWRRLLVSSETTIAQLHQYIQVAFNWSGEHWHRFRIHGKDYGVGYLGGISFDDNPHAVRLSCPDCGQPRLRKGHHDASTIRLMKA